MPQPARQKMSQPRPDLREDAIHFRSGTVQVQVDVTPRRRRTPMGDLILRGFVGEKEIEVVFPGRRQAAAVHLLQKLQAKLQLKKLDTRSPELSNLVDKLRISVRVDGSWRIRLMNEQDASPERRFQLVAARWRYRSGDGIEHVYGHLPNS